MKFIKISSNIGAMDKKKGIELAPGLIVKHMKDFFLKENDLLPIFDVSEIDVDGLNMQNNNKKIFEYIAQTDCPAVILGGDHSITYPCFKAFSKKFDNPGLIIFDAHPDCENNFSPPTHEDFLKVLIIKNHVKAENVVLVGLRNMHSKELEFLKKNKIKYFAMKEFSCDGCMEVSDAFMNVSRRFDALYLSIDIDVVDPAFAPGTGYIEPGGFTSRELLFFIQRIRMLKNLKMADIVEVNPKKDVNNITVKLAAKIAVELC
ncbi:hypothetical protein GF327_01065 [Candidatus Woesearchaeota archaeon]|nr:hypothetical protein [Candidatus Woesearchaeota archaeon]